MKACALRGGSSKPRPLSPFLREARWKTFYGKRCGAAWVVRSRFAVLRTARCPAMTGLKWTVPPTPLVLDLMGLQVQVGTV
jgi:hypothetical protein